MATTKTAEVRSVLFHNTDFDCERTNSDTDGDDVWNEHLGGNFFILNSELNKTILAPGVFIFCILMRQRKKCA